MLARKLGGDKMDNLTAVWMCQVGNTTRRTEALAIKGTEEQL